MSNRADKIRGKSLVTFTVNGNEYQVRRPGVMTLVRCGAQRLSFSHSTKSKDDLTALVEAGDVEGIIEKVGGELEFMHKLCAACMVDPRLHDGPIETCPDNSVTLEMIEDDYPQLGKQILELAGQSEALAAAKAAEAFREDSGRAPAEPGGPVLPDPAQPAAEG